MADRRRHNAESQAEPVYDRLITITTALLADVGPSGVKVRRITEGAGASPIAVYHHFGGVSELLKAVVHRGYRTLRAALQRAAHADPDPGVQLFAMALSCRHVAQDNPHLYDMMFGLSTRGTYRYVADPADGGPAEQFLEAYSVMVAACGRLVQSERVSVGDGQQVAAQLWSVVHGFVTLELSGHFARCANPVVEVLTPMATNHFVGMGDERWRADASAAGAITWWNTEGPGSDAQ